MKLINKIILSVSVIISALAVLACAAFLPKTKTTAFANNSAKNYLDYLTSNKRGSSKLNLAASAANSDARVKITNNTKNGETNLIVSHLSITVFSWENITSFEIKRVVQTTAQSVSTDDAGNTCAFDSSSIPNANQTTTFNFYQDGGYLVIYTYATPVESEDGDTTQTEEQTYAVYTEADFSRQVDLNTITVQGGKLHTNLKYSDGNINLLVANNQNITLTLPTTYNQDLYTITLSIPSTTPEVSSESSLEITKNQNITLSIKQKHASSSTNAALEKHNIEAFVQFPKIAFKNSQGQTQSDVFASWPGTAPNTNGVLFFNTQVTPFLDDIIQTEFKKRFTFSVRTENNTNYAEILIIANNEVISSTTYKIQTNPSDNLTLKIGGSGSDAPIYQNWANTTSTVYTTGAIYPFANNSQLTVVSSVDTKNINGISGYNGQVIMYGKTKNNEVEFAYAFNWRCYSSNYAAITLTSSGNQIGITKHSSDIQVPIDLIVINSQTGERFSKEDILSNSTSTILKIRAAGKFRIIVKYRDDISADDANNATHKILPVTITGAQISIVSNSKYMLQNEVSNSTVTVSSTDPFDVYLNDQKLGSYTGATMFDQTGRYSVVSNGITRNFEIISTTLPAYTFGTHDNFTPISLSSSNGFTQEITSIFTNISSSGTYTITYTLLNSLSVELDNDSDVVTNISTLTYNVTIIAPQFSINTNVKNGETTSKNVVLTSISAAGDWTIKITCNGKSKIYTAQEFGNLSTKKHTLTQNGNYTITVTDGNGYQYQMMFTKYYQMSIGLIILISLLALGLAAGIFFIIRLRLKAKVR